MESERLRLRPVDASDLDRLHAMWTDPDIRRYVWENRALSREDTLAIIETSSRLHADSGAGLWLAERRDAGEPVGFGGYWYFGEADDLRILFGLKPEHWGLGLATELASCLIRYGFEQLGLERITGATSRANVSSQRVMEKAGMRFSQRVRSRDSDQMFYIIDRQG
ncbi:MAG TPA: GNAT family N-acetyltransferase [Gammaproteobacteria bacterium]|nr:GNAT family N-acetyltransferase [Gammaproteobacteria bacterium]